MGRLIDADLLAESLQDFVDWCRDERRQGVAFVLDCSLPNSSPVEAIPKADYETHLKADLVAILEEIDLEMSEQSFGIQTEPWEVVEKLRKKIIQQKINVLKAETEAGNGNNNNSRCSIDRME